MSVPADLLTNTANAQTAYSDALNQARNAQNALFQTYGYTSADASGNYSVGNAQSAFDPNSLFKDSNTGLDMNKVKGMANNLQIGGTGSLANIERTGATAVSDVTEAAQHSGFDNASGVGGGIINQRQDLARTTAEGNLLAGKNQFVTDVAGALAPIGQASADVKKARVMDSAVNRETTASNANYAAMRNVLERMGAPATTAPTTTSGSNVISAKDRAAYATRGTPVVSGKPVSKSGKPGQVITGDAGVKWDYRPSGPKGASWYKK